MPRSMDTDLSYEPCFNDFVLIAESGGWRCVRGKGEYQSVNYQLDTKTLLCFPYDCPKKGFTIIGHIQ